MNKEIVVPLETVVVKGKSYQVTPKTAAFIRKAYKIPKFKEVGMKVSLQCELKTLENGSRCDPQNCIDEECRQNIALQREYFKKLKKKSPSEAVAV